MMRINEDIEPPCRRAGGRSVFAASAVLLSSVRGGSSGELIMVTQGRYQYGTQPYTGR